MKRTIDFNLCDAGSVVGISPVTRDARVWFSENVQEPEPYQRWGSWTWMDRRLAAAIFDAIVADGFRVRRS